MECAETKISEYGNQKRLTFDGTAYEKDRYWELSFMKLKKTYDFLCIFWIDASVNSAYIWRYKGR